MYIKAKIKVFISSKLPPMAKTNYKTKIRSVEKLSFPLQTNPDYFWNVHHHRLQTIKLTKGSGKPVTKHRLSELNRQTVLQLVVYDESKSGAESVSLKPLENVCNV